ncbi:hypothetical protein [Sphaerisporangium perillae]|uniref:hypothetical protein n=1 Tax=Sphaerisporangium perillae TaxID=2935860 RepID=UPI00200C5AD1|nr:hypothetical protein [Sphaerisporangium perillae]
MANEVTEGKAAARELAARLPGWAVWYGEHTGRFWAMPRASAPAGARLAEADTAEELEGAVRELVTAAQNPATPAQQAQGTAMPGQQGPRPEQSQMDPQYNRQPVGARH